MLAFLRVLSDIIQRSMATDRYKDAKSANNKFKQIAKIEMKRQLRKMQERQG